MGNYTVYGAEFCPRCEKATKALESGGNKVHHIDLESLTEPAMDWPKRANEQIAAMADHAMRNMEMPSIQCLDSGEWLAYDDVVEEVEAL